MSMALVLAFQGDRPGAIAEMEGVRRAQDGEDPQPVIAAMVYAGLGDTDEAIRLLQLALDRDYPYLEYLPSNPFFDSLRTDPRFSDLLHSLGL